MKATEQFKSVMENYLIDKAQNDTAFAPAFAKHSKNLESCFNYIFGEVKKTGCCAFDNQEIYDMAVKYYTDDSIGVPPPISCKAVVAPPAKADLFSAAPAVSETPIQKTEVPKPVKPATQTLTLFDL
ncbi:PcfK-like family protein [Flavobacterium agrisoli]|uniref:PcfK-like family protein n=1 Tax=Flavobacterium agrisoli TaxID=2793066 RepID=A0A934UIB5_9FLAO|nr:Cas9 inhibitor AcrIIA9 family protein [Flavobacterium agrisoli]MBK0368642.1 PcfK-like family protein [Flavobacterium agrisoli]